MDKKVQQSEFEKRVLEYIDNTLLPELKIIFGTQYPGLKPELSCALIVEEGLKIYLRKIDPEQFIGKIGLGKIYGLCSKKSSFPKRFKVSIPKVNNVRVGKVHVKKDPDEVSLEYIQNFTSDFIKWFYSKVARQDISSKIQTIIRPPKENQIERSKRTNRPNHNIVTKSPLQNSLQKSFEKISQKKAVPRKHVKPVSKKPLSHQDSKISLTMTDGIDFSRTYFENIEITRNVLRGIKSELYKEIPGLSLFIEFSKDGLYFTNQSEGIVIYLDNKRLIKNRKKLIEKNHFDILFNNIKLICTINKY